MTGGGTQGSTFPNFNKQALADIGTKKFNLWMNNLPMEEAYKADVLAPTADRTEKVQGQVNADMWQKVGSIPLDAGRSPAMAKPEELGEVLNKGMNNAASNVEQQRIAGASAIVQNGLGESTTAQTGMEGLAKMSTENAIQDMQSNYMKDSAVKSSMATIGGALAGAAGAYTYGKMNPAKKTPAPVKETWT